MLCKSLPQAQGTMKETWKKDVRDQEKGKLRFSVEMFNIVLRILRIMMNNLIKTQTLLTKKMLGFGIPFISYSVTCVPYYTLQSYGYLSSSGKWINKVQTATTFQTSILSLCYPDLAWRSSFHAWLKKNFSLIILAYMLPSAFWEVF